MSKFINFIRNPFSPILLLIITIFFAGEMPSVLAVGLMGSLIGWLSYLVIGDVLESMMGKKQQIRIEQLEARVHQLEARLSKDSSTSE